MCSGYAYKHLSAGRLATRKGCSRDIQAKLCHTIQRHIQHPHMQENSDKSDIVCDYIISYIRIMHNSNLQSECYHGTHIL